MGGRPPETKWATAAALGPGVVCGASVGVGPFEPQWSTDAMRPGAVCRKFRGREWEGGINWLGIYVGKEVRKYRRQASNILNKATTKTYQTKPQHTKQRPNQSALDKAPTYYAKMATNRDNRQLTLVFI